MVWILALSVQDQVERYGAYVGIAAFLGLALLSLLFFAQARELRRLREWAGRAPERARELEQRVTASADAARRPEGTPAYVPEPVGAAATAGGRSGTVGRAVPLGTPRPAGSGPGEDPDATLVPEPLRTNGANAIPPATAAGAAAPASAPDGGAASAPAAAPAPGAVPAPAAGSQEGSSEAPVAGSGADGGGAPPSAGDGQETQEAAALPQEGGEIAAKRLGDGDGREDAPAAPSAPARPAAAPLRAAQPAAAVPARRFTPTGAPPRRPSPPPVVPEDEEGSRRPLWAVLLASALAVVVLAGGAFAATRALTGEDEPAPPRAAREAPPAGGDQAARTPSRRVTSAVRARTTVAVLNGTTISGLAARTRDAIVGLGYREGAVADAEDTGRSASIVYSAEGARAQADEIGRRLQISDVRAMEPGVAAIAAASGPQADVVVVVGSDQSSGAAQPGATPAEPTATPTAP